MTDKQLKQLSRAELLEMLVHLSEENERLNREIEALGERLADRALRIEKAGSIAEASMRLSGVFEDAQNAASQYLENVRRLEGEAQARAEALLARTHRRCAEAEADAERKLADVKRRCVAMVLDVEKYRRAVCGLEPVKGTAPSDQEALREQLKNQGLI